MESAGGCCFQGSSHPWLTGSEFDSVDSLRTSGEKEERVLPDDHVRQTITPWKQILNHVDEIEQLIFKFVDVNRFGSCCQEPVGIFNSFDLAHVAVIRLA